MARPLSEAKRDAILTAAAKLIATSGTGASTASIAKVAGVAEGTIFTYFATKDNLLNELFLEIETDLAQTMKIVFPTNSDPRERVWLIWDKLIDWGAANPTWCKVLRQLKVSDRITTETRRICNALFHESRDLVERSMAGRVDPERMTFYIDTVLIGLADITIDAVVISPKEQHEQLKRASFDLYWKGTAA